MKNTKKIIGFGEVLWDIVSDHRLVGGAPLNVCYHLSKFGIDSKIVSQVGADVDGFSLLDEIQLLGVSTEYISTSDTRPTSKVLVHTSVDGEITYEIVENTAWDFIRFDEKIANEIALSNCFVYGSLVTRNSTSKNTLLAYLKHAHWKVLDLNLRFPYYNKDIVCQLLSSSNSLKINEEELLIIGDMFFPESKTRQELIDRVFSTFPDNEEIILTRGAEGVSYYTKEEVIEVPGIKIRVMDTIGSGDSFLAAYLAGRLEKKPILECLHNAVALSSFVASTRGACPVYDVEEIKTGRNLLSPLG